MYVLIAFPAFYAEVAVSRYVYNGGVIIIIKYKSIHRGELITDWPGKTNRLAADASE